MFLLNQIIKYFLLIFIIFILEVTIFSFYPIAGIKPDLLLVVVIINGLLTGVETGAKFGAGAGLFQDIFLVGLWGKNTILKLLLGSIMGSIEGKIFKKNYFLPFVLIFCSTVIIESVLLSVTADGIRSINYLQKLQDIILPVALYNGIIGFSLYPLFYKLLKIGD